jgi:hypothetical protein
MFLCISKKIDETTSNHGKVVNSVLCVIMFKLCERSMQDVQNKVNG